MLRSFTVISCIQLACQSLFKCIVFDKAIKIPRILNILLEKIISVESSLILILESGEIENLIKVALLLRYLSFIV